MVIVTGALHRPEPARFGAPHGIQGEVRQSDFEAGILWGMPEGSRCDLILCGIEPERPLTRTCPARLAPHRACPPVGRGGASQTREKRASTIF